MSFWEWFASLHPRAQLTVISLLTATTVGGTAVARDAAHDPAPAPEPPAVGATWTPPATIAMLAIATPSPEMTDYDRDDWPHWRDLDGDCQNTRHEVLVEEAAGDVEVEFRDEEQCTVVAGHWLDPYGGETFTNPRRLDVDHLVPLANAHRSGAWEWDREQRTAYANDLDDPQHLLAVSASLNRQKGSRGPEAWMPPLESYWCRYAVDWIAVKDRWGLTVTAEEWAALEEMLAACPEGAPAVVP